MRWAEKPRERATSAALSPDRASSSSAERAASSVHRCPPPRSCAVSLLRIATSSHARNAVRRSAKARRSPMGYQHRERSAAASEADHADERTMSKRGPREANKKCIYRRLAGCPRHPEADYGDEAALDDPPGPLPRLRSRDRHPLPRRAHYDQRMARRADRAARGDVRRSDRRGQDRELKSTGAPRGPWYVVPRLS